MKLERSSDPIYTIQENGAISTPNLGEGRFIVGLVLNSEQDDRLKEIIDIHQQTLPGDVVSQWSIKARKYFKPKKWSLHLVFKQPVEYSCFIEFDLENDYSLIDTVMRSQGIYLAYGKKGEKFSTKRGDCILIELPSKGIKDMWDKKLREIVSNRLKKNHIPKSELKHITETVIAEMRDVQDMLIK